MSALQCCVVLACVLVGEPDGMTLKGTVTDSNGQPIAGARVDIATAAPRVGKGLFCPSCYRDCQKRARSNGQGQFEIGGLDPTLKFHVLVSMSGKVAKLTDLVDPLVDDVKVALADLPQDLPPERTLRGQAVDDKGRAIEGALIDPAGAQTTEKRWWGRVDVHPTVSDSDGRFVMPLPPGYQGVDITITADGYAGISAALLAPGEKEHRVLVPRGARVTGRMVYEGKPLSGVRVAVVQEDRSATNHFIKAVGDVTDDEGKFAFNYLPCNERYVIFSVVGEGPQEFVLSTKRFKMPGDDEERDLGDLEALPALRLAGRVELSAGATLPADAKITLHRDPAWDLIAIPVREDGHFEIGGLPPEAYELRIAVKGVRIQDNIPYQILSEQSFGLFLTQSMDALRIPVQPSSELAKAEKTAEPTSDAKPTRDRAGFVSGRVLKGDQPRPNVVMKLFSRMGRLVGEATTDADGKYSIGGLKAGDAYYFAIVDPERLIAAGWSYQLPYYHTLQNDQRETKLPDVHLVSAGQALRGLVVDLQGRGVAGIRVTARMANGGSIGHSLGHRGSTSKTSIETDGDGKFELQNLPDDLVELMAYRASTKGGQRILFPAKVRPQINQTDIRIVFDPLLDKELEDLDAPKRKTEPKE